MMGSHDPETLKREFEAMDTSGDGSLDVDELHAVFKNLGKEVKRGTVANLVRLADEDGNGTLEWEEFEQIFEVAAKYGKKKAGEAAPAAKEAKAEAPAEEKPTEAAPAAKEKPAEAAPAFSPPDRIAGA